MIESLIHVTDQEVADLRDRLARTRWPDEGWSEEGAGAPPSIVRSLAERWQHEYDWRSFEAGLRHYDWGSEVIDGQRVSYIRGSSGHPGARLLVLLHGWPSTFLEMVPLIGPLTQPNREEDEAFDVIIPSLPGFPMSERRDNQVLGYREVAALITKLIKLVAGTRPYFVHGADWGAAVATGMALMESTILGIHVTGIVQPEGEVPDRTSDERAFAREREEWRQAEGAYFHLLSTQTRTFAFGVDDSPATLLAWLVDKHLAWGDFPGGFPPSVEHHLLDTASLFWFTKSLGMSARIYRDSLPRLQLKLTEFVHTPTSVMVLPDDVSRPPRSWVERRYNVVRWRCLPRGGHFPALEVPELLLGDLRMAVAR